MDEEGRGWRGAAPGRRPLLRTRWPAWHTTSVGHGFVWEGCGDVLHGHAVHDGAE